MAKVVNAVRLERMKVQVRVLLSVRGFTCFIERVNMVLTGKPSNGYVSKWSNEVDCKSIAERLRKVQILPYPRIAKMAKAIATP